MVPYRLVLSPRLAVPRWLKAATLIGGIAFGLLCCAIFLIAFGVPASDLANQFILYVFGNSAGLDQTLTRAISLVLVSLSVALCLRIRFWNIGVEGQLWMGAIGATAVSFYHIGPWFLRMPLMIVAAALGGALWCGIAAVAKIRLRADEVITTLLLNYVAQDFLLHLVYGAWKDAADSFPHSPAFPAAARLPPLPFGISTALPIALLVALSAWWLASGTRFGLYMRFVQANPRMAGAVGVPLRATVLGSVLLSGAAAGLAGFCIVAGDEGRLTQSFYAGHGFSGILIAFVARNSPLIAIPVALAIGWLFVTGQSLQVFYQVPFAMVQLIQAIIVIAVAASEFFMRHRLRWVR